MEKINEDILSMAKELLNQSEDIVQNIYIRQDLENFIEDFSVCGDETDFQDMLQVITRICTDDTDIRGKGFQLEEIPHKSVYCFHNIQNQWFDVYLNHFNGGKESVTVGYVGEDSCTHDAENIETAIKQYCLDN